MKSYTDFAYIYDRLIEQDYNKWADRLEQVFQSADGDVRLVLDLGCGTGNMTGALARRGYDMIGLDSSPDMLTVAEGKKDGLPIQYICQDMTDFELYGTVDAIVSTLDCINYITDLKKLADMMRLVRNYLNPGGLFVFDINSEYKISQLLGNNSFIFDNGEIFYTWENVFNPKSRICTFELTFFMKKGEKYERIDEVQKQRAYSEGQIRKILSDAGLEVIGCYSGLTHDLPDEKSEKIMFVCKNIC